MVSIALIGNCQVRSFEKALDLMIPGCKTLSVDIARNAETIETDLQAFQEAAKGFDIVLYQHHILKEEGTRFVRDSLGGRSVSIANFHFRGLHPDCCCLYDVARTVIQPSYYHNAILLDSYLRGLPPAKALDRVGLDLFERAGLTDVWENSLRICHQRDAFFDVPAADLVDAACRRGQGFLNINHPSFSLVQSYVSRLLPYLGLRGERFDPLLCSDPLEMFDVVPVHDFWAEYMGLPYRTTQKWLLGYPSRRFVTFETYAERCYAFYKSMPKADLKIQFPQDLAELRF